MGYNNGGSSSFFGDINRNNEKDMNPFGKSNNVMLFNFDYSFLSPSNSKEDLIREIKILHKKVDRCIEENKNLNTKELLKNKFDEKADSLIDKYKKIEEKFNNIIKTNNKKSGNRKSDDDQLIFKLEL